MCAYCFVLLVCLCKYTNIFVYIHITPWKHCSRCSNDVAEMCLNICHSHMSIGQLRCIDTRKYVTNMKSDHLSIANADWSSEMYRYMEKQCTQSVCQTQMMISQQRCSDPRKCVSNMYPEHIQSQMPSGQQRCIGAKQHEAKMYSEHMSIANADWHASAAAAAVAAAAAMRTAIFLHLYRYTCDGHMLLLHLCYVIESHSNFYEITI